MISMNIDLKQTQDTPPSFTHLLQAAQDAFSFSDQNNYKFFDDGNELKNKLDCEAFENSITKQQARANEKHRKEQAKGKENEQDNGEMNAFLTAFLTLAMVCPEIDISKLLEKDKAKEAKKDFVFAPKKKKSPKQLSKTPTNLNKRSYDKSIRNSKTCRL